MKKKAMNSVCFRNMYGFCDKYLVSCGKNSSDAWYQVETVNYKVSYLTFS